MLAATHVAAEPSSAAGTSMTVLALDRLIPSLRHAFHYAVTVAAQRHPSAWLLAVHRFRDEVYLLLSVALETHSLCRHGASFGEHVYGLRRVLDRDCTSRRQRIASLLAQLMLLLLPQYIRSKMDAPQDGGGRTTSQLLSATDPTAPPSLSSRGSNDDHSDGASASPGMVNGTVATSRRVRTLLWSIWVRIRHYGRALLDGGNLTQLILFLHGRSPYATVTQRLLGFTLTTAPVDAAPQPTTAAAVDSMTSTNMPAWLRRLHQLGSVVETPLHYARQLLLLSLFSYRLLEWWHAPQHAPLPPPRLIPPPPPPPVYIVDHLVSNKGAASNLSVQPQAGVCGYCRMAPREPTAASTGYVYCASCVHSALRKSDPRCPMSGQPIRADGMRRLFETSRAPTVDTGE